MHDDLSFSNVVLIVYCVLCIKVFYVWSIIVYYCLLLSCFNWQCWQCRIDWRGGGRGG